MNSTPIITSSTAANTHYVSAARRNLQRLNIIRSIAIGGQCLSLYYFWQIENIGLPLSLLISTLALYTIIFLFSSWRCRWPKNITEPEFFGHLLMDIGFFTTLLYFSGGASNPFVSYYLVPISIAAATLSNRYTWSVTILSVIAYSCLLKFNYPIQALAPDIDPHAQHAAMSENEKGINLHILGMWANFLVSAVLITYFVVQMANELRRQEQRLVEQREDQLRDEQVLAVATLAAGTAHELGTPLNTMQILLDEIEASQINANTPSELIKDISTLRQQVITCRATLRQLVATAQLNSSQQSHSESASEYFDSLFENWLVMRPDVNVTMTTVADLPNINVNYTPTMAQALQNLLNNAADASPSQVDVELNWNHQCVELKIRDYGEGINPELLEQMGQAFVSSKSDGLGIGLFLAKSAIARFGGTLTIDNANNPSGVITRVSLPLQQLLPSIAR